MNRIVYNGAEYTDIVSAELFSELSPISETLGYGTFNAVVKSKTTAILNYTENTPLTYYRDGETFATYFVKRIKRVGKIKYAIEAYDIIGVLSKQQHMGGIYTGQTAKEIIDEVCGDISIVYDDPIINTRLYGWLPIGTRRDNLRRVLFALGAVGKSSRWGELHIAVLSQSISEEISKIGVGVEVDYPEPVGIISLTEHQFIKAPQAEAATLFEGITEDGDLIQFDDPVYDITAEGIPLKTVHANYAIVGAGNGTLSGKKYTHTKRELTQILGHGSEEAIYDAATLVSVINSAAVLARLANYHSSADVISAATRQKMQAPGDSVNILHPYDLKLTGAFLLDRQVTVSRELVSYQRFLLGFVPPDPTEGVYNRVDVISASGTFTVPDGVTSLRIVLIGGGSGGESGLPGEAAGDNSVEESSGTNSTTKISVPGAGGKGGKAGKAGSGGKVYQKTLSVTPGQQFAVTIGAAGKGGAYSADAQNTGTAGGASVFGIYTSADGAQSVGGFLEEVSGAQFAHAGQDGMAGGKGSGVENREPVYAEGVIYKGIAYLPGASHYDAVAEDSYSSGGNLYTRARATGGFGGGAAAGSNGIDGEADSFASAGPSSVQGAGGLGGKGADASAPTPAVNYGAGGDGGNGGGGGGARGAANAYKDTYYAPNAELVVSGTDAFGNPAGLNGGAGGAGSDGGDGAPGCVLVYYYVHWETTVDYFETADGEMFYLADSRQLITLKEEVN